MAKKQVYILLCMLWCLACVDGQHVTPPPPPLISPSVLSTTSSLNSLQEECSPITTYIGNMSHEVTFGVSKPNTIAHSRETCKADNGSLATMECVRYDPSNGTYFSEIFFPLQERFNDYLEITNLKMLDSDLLSLISYQDAFTDAKLRNVFFLARSSWNIPFADFSIHLSNISSENTLRLLSLALRVSNTSVTRNMAYLMFTEDGQNKLFKQITAANTSRLFSQRQLTRSNFSKIIDDAGLETLVTYEKINWLSTIRQLSNADILQYLSLKSKLTFVEVDQVSLYLNKITDSEVFHLMSLWDTYSFSPLLQAMSWAIVISQDNLSKLSALPTSASDEMLGKFIAFTTLSIDWNYQKLIQLSRLLNQSMSSRLPDFTSPSNNISTVNLTLLRSPITNISNEQLSKFLSNATNISHSDLSKLLAYGLFCLNSYTTYSNIKKYQITPIIKYILNSQPSSRQLNNILNLAPYKFTTNLTSNNLTLKDIIIFTREAIEIIQHIHDDQVIQSFQNSLSSYSPKNTENFPKAAYDRESLTSIPCVAVTTTVAPTTVAPTTVAPTTVAPTTVASTTEVTTTEITTTVAEEISCSSMRISSHKMTLNFNPTIAGSVASSNERCNETGRPKATIRCIESKQQFDASEKTGVFDNSTLHTVPCSITIKNLNISNIKNNEVSSTLEVLTAQPDSLSPTDVSVATDILSQYQKNVKNKTIAVSELVSITQSINNLAVAVDIKPEKKENNVNDGKNETTPVESNSAEAKSALLSTLNDFVQIVSLPPNQTTLEISSEEISVQIQSIKPTRVDPEGNETKYDDVSFDLKTKGSSQPTLVNIPSDVLSNIAETGKNPVISVTVIDEGLSLDASQNTSQVVSVQAKNVDASTKISFSIDFNVEIIDSTTETNNPLKNRLDKSEIMEWDFNNSQWKKTVNCHQLQNNVSQSAYACDTFSSYAILFSSVLIDSHVALTVVGYFGCCLSILFLLATVIIHLAYKKIRQTPTAITLVNICLCLLAVYFFYAVGIGRTSSKQTCDAMTFILHYATLACVGWMTINAYQMYKAFTDFTYNMKSNLILLHILGYGLPFILVLINFSSTVLSLDTKNINSESLYRSKTACWLQGPSLSWGFLLPIGIMLLFNFAVFGCLLRKVTCAKKKIKSSGKGKPLIDRFVNAVTMVTMMGLTWVFGYLLLIAEDVNYQSVMQWLFTLLNTFQGVVIFYLYCIRRRNVRKVWLPCDTFTLPSLSQTKSTSAKSAVSTSGSHKRDGVSTSGV